MRVTNTSRYDLQRIKELLEFSARGVKDSGVEVHVKNSSRGWKAYAYSEIPYIANVAATSKYLITIHTSQWLPSTTWTNVQRIDRLWPEGIPLDSWEDVFVRIAAHEFRHIWQFQRTERTGKGGKGEYDAEKFAFKRLNQWRGATKRLAVPALPQPNPFIAIDK